MAKIFVDAQANEAYLADGYLNKRVAVIDADTGKLKRYWGAYGNRPDDTPLPAYNPAGPPNQQFRNPVHCADLSVDRMLYVCDRAHDRLQVFTPDGKFVKEAFFGRNTKASGSVWDIAFSKRSAAEIHVHPGRHEQPSACHRPPVAAGADDVRRRRTAAGPVLRRAQHRHRFKRATSTRRRRGKENGSRSSCSRAWRPFNRTRAWSGRKRRRRNSGRFQKRAVRSCGRIALLILKTSDWAARDRAAAG